MDKEKINEMKQIQQGLEAFLEKEIGTNREPDNVDSQMRTSREQGKDLRQETDWEAEDEAAYEAEAGWKAEDDADQGAEVDWEAEDDADQGAEVDWEAEDEAARGEEAGRGEENDTNGEYEGIETDRGITAGWESEEDIEAEQEMVVDWDAKERSQKRPTGRTSKVKRQLDGKQRTQPREYVKKEMSVPMGRPQQNNLNAQGKGQSGRLAQTNKSGQSTQRDKSGKLTQAGRAVQRDKSGKLSQAGRAVQRDKSGKLSQAGRAVQPGRSNKPVQPAETGKKAKKKRRKKGAGFLKFLTAVVFIVALLGFGLHKVVGVVYDKMNFKEIASVEGLPMKEDGVVNILLIGNDSRENGDDGRSDAMILLSISSKTKSIYMTSLLRDMYVEIPGHDGNRLNAAYAYGGAELLMETIENNFDIPVNRYILVNFEAFANLVDAVGGVDLDLTSQEIEYVNGYLVEYNMLTGRPQGTDDMDTSLSGMVHLNGPQALAYSRNRYLGTDFGRTERQRKVLTAVLKKLPTALLTNTEGLMDGLLPNLTTNLTQNECFQLSLMAGKLLTYDIVSDNIPQPGTYKDVIIRKMEVLEVDFNTNIKYLKEKIYGE